jgi:hypothetical protein
MLAVLRTAYLDRRTRYFEEEAEILAEVVAEGMRARVFHVHDPSVTARSLVLATNALLPYSLSARELGSRKVVEAEAARIADLLLAGLEAPSAAHASAPRSRKHRTKIPTDTPTRETKP